MDLLQFGINFFEVYHQTRAAAFHQRTIENTTEEVYLKQNKRRSGNTTVHKKQTSDAVMENTKWSTAAYDWRQSEATSICRCSREKLKTETAAHDYFGDVCRRGGGGVLQPSPPPTPLLDGGAAMESHSLAGSRFSSFTSSSVWEGGTPTWPFSTSTSSSSSSSSSSSCSSRRCCCCCCTCCCCRCFLRQHGLNKWGSMSTSPKRPL